MPQPRPLPRSLAPLPGESLPGFLLRLSCRLNQPPARVAELTGLKSAGVRESRVAAVLVSGIPQAVLPVFTRMTRLTDSQAGQLGMAAWQERYPVPVPDAEAGPRRLNSRSVFAPATRYCPECLAGDESAIQESLGGPWLKAWHLPVVFACPLHQRLLEHRCPDCGCIVRGPRRGATATLLPALRAAGLHPAQCRAERTLNKGGRSLPDCCGARLDQARNRRPANPELIALQDKILGILDRDGPVSTLSAGLPTQPIRYFADIRAIGLLACSTWPEARSLSPSEEAASAIDEHVALLQSKAAGRQAASAGTASRTRFDIPPADAAASSGLAHIADRILDGTPDEVRERLRQFLPGGTRKASRSYWGLSMVRSATRCSEGLYAAYAPLFWGFTKGGSQPQGRRNAVVHPQRWGPENVPAFLPQGWYDRHFTPIPGVSERFIRRTAALRLVQVVAGGSLGEAAGFLGIASTDTTWARKSGIYTGVGHVHTGARQQPDPSSFESALEALARELDDPATTLVNYQRRRQVLETWQIDDDTWGDLVSRLPDVPSLQRPDLGACKRQVASIYVWVDVTSGEHHFAPRPLEAAQPPEIQQAWKDGQRSNIWGRMHRSRPIPHYTSLKRELEVIATALAKRIDTHHG
jgi:hypothetical protein